MTQLLVSGECERYELKIDYVAMDQVCTSSIDTFLNQTVKKVFFL